MLAARDSRPQHLDTLGRLCIQGREVSSYLFQVPSDEEQTHEIRAILRGVIAECERTSHSELPRIAVVVGNDHDFGSAPPGTDVVWSFRAADPPALAVLDRSPGANTTEIPRDQPITITFTDGVKQTQIDIRCRPHR